MTLPTAYLTSVKHVPEILEAIKRAQAPTRFTQKFLEGLGFSSVSDRLTINMLKTLGFLNDSGQPIQRYFEFLDSGRSGAVLAEALREAYADLFEIHRNAQGMSQTELKNKMKTLSQGQHSDAVLQKMATTFTTLAKAADFSAATTTIQPPAAEPPELVEVEQAAPPRQSVPAPGGNGFPALVYSIQLHLPESRDPAVYDALFRSLKEHLYS